VDIDLEKLLLFSFIGEEGIGEEGFGGLLTTLGCEVNRVWVLLIGFSFEALKALGCS